MGRRCDKPRGSDDDDGEHSVVVVHDWSIGWVCLEARHVAETGERRFSLSDESCGENYAASCNNTGYLPHVIKIENYYVGLRPT